MKTLLLHLATLLGFIRVVGTFSAWGRGSFNGSICYTQVTFRLCNGSLKFLFAEC